MGYLMHTERNTRLERKFKPIIFPRNRSILPYNNSCGPPNHLIQREGKTQLETKTGLTFFPNSRRVISYSGGQIPSNCSRQGQGEMKSITKTEQKVHFKNNLTLTNNNFPGTINH